MKPLVEPMKGWVFNVGKNLIHLNWAKTGVWAENGEGEKRTYLIVSYVSEIRKGTGSVKSFIIGPFKMMIGIPENNEIILKMEQE